MINSPIALLDDPDDPSLVALHLLNVFTVSSSLFPDHTRESNVGGLVKTDWEDNSELRRGHCKEQAWSTV